MTRALDPGHHPVPPGHLATIVTHLEMATPPSRACAEAPSLTLDTVAACDVARYRRLFTRVGAPWL